MSAEIVSGIDETALKISWAKFQRGEPNAFSQSLYTLQGRRSFDDVKRRYAQEPDFKQVADRYVADFEKLLAESAQNQAGPEETQAYLMSDTGKVYTMLAHASGRLG